MIDRQMWRGVSVDLDAVEGEMVEAAEDGKSPSVNFTEGRVSSATLCAIPAFAEAFIRNGTWAEFAHLPLPTGAMVEIPDWPGIAMSLVASGAAPVSADFFRNPMLTEPTPVTLGKDGHIFGHLAEWSTCHIAYEVCTTAPAVGDGLRLLPHRAGLHRRRAGRGGAADGRRRPRGRQARVRAAIAHYDNVAAAVADITVFEDEHGIAFSGRIRPWATEQQIHELFAAGPSGDWREVRSRGLSSMELVAAHAVNVQGFPVARPRARFALDGERQVSLVAAGALAPRAQEDAAALIAEIRELEFSHINEQFNTLKEK